MKFLLMAYMGLGNRLHVLANLNFLIDKCGWKEVHVYWPVTTHCPGAFEDYFVSTHPMIKVESCLEHNTLMRRAICLQVKKKVPLMTYKDSDLIYVDGWAPGPVVKKFIEIEVVKNHEVLDGYMQYVRPRADIEKAVDEFVERTGPLDTGIHVRRTDFSVMMWKMNRRGRGALLPDDDEVVRYVSESAGRVYLATDDAKVQALLKSHFPDKVVYYGDVVGQGPEQLRTTSFEHSIIDMWLLGRCQKIIPTEISTFSYISMSLARIRKRAERAAEWASSEAVAESL